MEFTAKRLMLVQAGASGSPVGNIEYRSRNNFVTSEGCGCRMLLDLIKQSLTIPRDYHSPELDSTA